MEKVMRGEVDEEMTTDKAEAPQSEAAPEKEVDLGLEPPVPEFILDVTNINPLDLCVCLFSHCDLCRLFSLFTVTS